MKRFVRRAVVGLALWLAVAGAVAQEPGGYDAMRLDRAGEMRGNLSGQLEVIRGNVRIVLLSDDPGEPEVPIEADEITFTYDEGDSMPREIVLVGGVFIEHPRGTMRSARATWNFETGEVVFTGSPVLTSDQVKRMEAEQMIINLETGEFEAIDPYVPEMDARGNRDADAGPAAPSDPAMFTEDDITDWRVFMNELKRGALEDAPPSPAQRMVALLTPEQRRSIQGPDAATLAGSPQARELVLSALNGIVLPQPGLYSEAAWAGIDVSGEAAALLDATDLSAGETMRKNRLLLEAAYPGLIVPME